MDAQTANEVSTVCDHCGCYDAVQVGDRWLCVDCYAIAGACCALKSSKPASADGEPDKDGCGC